MCVCVCTVCVCVRACVFSCGWLFVTPWTVVFQAPLSMGFSRQEYWSGLPFSFHEVFQTQIELLSPVSPALAGIFFTTEPSGKPRWSTNPYRCWKIKKKVRVTQSCPTLYISMDYSQLVSSVHGILQARTLECVAIPFSRGSSQPRDWTCVSSTAGRVFTVWATREALHCWLISPPSIWTNSLSGSLMK